jgi:molybdopterin-synthase adenylyltransferase
VASPLNAIIAPSGVSDIGAQLYHLTTGSLDRIASGCHTQCPYSGTLLAAGDSQPFQITGDHRAAQVVVEARRRTADRLATKLARRIDDVLWRLI